MTLSMAGRREGSAPHVGAAGVLALDAGVTRAQAAGWIAEAREFAAEWSELRAVFQNRLYGVCVRSPLQVRVVTGPGVVETTPKLLLWLAGV